LGRSILHSSLFILHRSVFVGRFDGRLDGWRFGSLLFELDDAGRERTHEEDVTAVIAGSGDDRLNGSLRGNTAAHEFAELENAIFDLPLPGATNGAGVAEDVLEMLLKTRAAFLI
jgi:hypothetical protein